MLIEYRHHHKIFHWNLPLIAQYESYKWSASCECPNADKDGYGYGAYAKYDSWEATNDGIVGYCETPTGIMVCHECPNCGTKWRSHIGYFKDVEEFREHMGLLFFLDHNKQKRYDKFLISEDNK